MIEVLKNKNQTTKFQILVEIADKGPDIQQREIARELDITPQAVSDYIAQLINDGMLVALGRSSYRVTNEGVNWVIKALKELNSYNLYIQRAVNNISICAALAEADLKNNQQVSLKMKDGLLYASPEIDNGASGFTVSSVKVGEDVGISGVQGIVPLKTGNITIFKVPDIARGGSRKVNYDALKKYAASGDIIAGLGIESYAALSKSGVDFYRYGVVDVTVEAARTGLNLLVCCVEGELNELIIRLEKEKIHYELVADSSL
ncbi:MAG: winged helix-turn-helix transcriptional regulator [Dehalococcoidales bacterium]|nr:winged helix-turn-helix transcriptional regulator [Dehalococcoidales bacterium]